MSDDAVDATLGRQLVDILSHYCGEAGVDEGAVETLERFIADRAALVAFLRHRVCDGRAEPRRYGGLRPECAGGLAYFCFGYNGIGPAESFEDALRLACAPFRPAQPAGAVNEAVDA